VVELLDAARRTTVRAVNSVMTATYWEIGRRIVEFGEGRAEYGEQSSPARFRHLETRAPR
jgi:hypothetical protein